jgi:cobalamin biosynthesis Mg chelatase CobN
VGAVATAALLNVGSSLRNLLLQLGEQGYYVGRGMGAIESKLFGEKIVSALKAISQDTGTTN